MHEARWSPCCNSLSRILRRLKGKRRGTRGVELRKLIQVVNCRFKKWENNLAPFPTCYDFLAQSWPPSDSRFNPQSAQAKFLSLMVWNARIPVRTGSYLRESVSPQVQATNPNHPSTNLWAWESPGNAFRLYLSILLYGWVAYILIWWVSFHDKGTLRLWWPKPSKLTRHLRKVTKFGSQKQPSNR